MVPALTSARGGPFSVAGITVANGGGVKPSIYNPPEKMCTFFLRIGVLAVLLAGCHRSRSETPAQPAPRADTLVVTVPVIRFTPAGSADGAATLDSLSLELLERRVMSRLTSAVRAQSEYDSGESSAGSGLTPAKNAAPKIRHGLLGVISFTDDGAMDVTSRDRIKAVHSLLKKLDGPLEIRALSNPGVANVEAAIARARLVYLELVGMDEQLGERDVAIIVNARNTTAPVEATVEIFWRDEK